MLTGCERNNEYRICNVSDQEFLHAKEGNNSNQKRMHSSRIRTAGSLPYEGSPQQRPPRQRLPWTETPLNRDPPGQRPPWTDPPPVNRITDRCRASSVLLFPTFWGLSYFFLLWGKIPTFSYFFRFSLQLIDEYAIFEPKNFFASLRSAYIPP